MTQKNTHANSMLKLNLKIKNISFIKLNHMHMNK